jgi:hypothetical protein
MDRSPEPKEQAGGFDIIECASLDEAVEIAARHPAPPAGQSRSGHCGRSENEEDRSPAYEQVTAQSASAARPNAVTAGQPVTFFAAPRAALFDIPPPAGPPPTSRPGIDQEPLATRPGKGAKAPPDGDPSGTAPRAAAAPRRQPARVENAWLTHTLSPTQVIQICAP